MGLLTLSSVDVTCIQVELHRTHWERTRCRVERERVYLKLYRNSICILKRYDHKGHLHSFVNTAPAIHDHFETKAVPGCSIILLYVWRFLRFSVVLCTFDSKPEIEVHGSVKKLHALCVCTYHWQTPIQAIVICRNIVIWRLQPKY